MISNVNKNVIFVKNIPSNIIEEAIFILKEDAGEVRFEEKIDIAKSEAELILQDYINDEIVNSLKNKNEEINKEQKIKKIFFVSIVIAVIVMGITSKIL